MRGSEGKRASSEGLATRAGRRSRINRDPFFPRRPCRRRTASRFFRAYVGGGHWSYTCLQGGMIRSPFLFGLLAVTSLGAAACAGPAEEEDVSESAESG